MEFSSFTFSQEGLVATITMNRPQALNALNKQFFTEINHLLDRLEQTQVPPLLIITGLGKAFAAGADISEMVGMNIREAGEFSQAGQRTLIRLEEYAMPVIAAINGYALGGGLELALACDIRLAADNARLAMPEASLGLIPGFGGTQRLGREIGLANALFMLLTTEAVNAEQALRLGLVQLVYPGEELMEAAHALAGKICSMGPQAIRNIKRVVRRGSTLPLQDGYELETNAFSRLFEKQGQIGMRAFLDKKKPVWENGK